MDNECPNNILPDGPVCPRCGEERAPSGADGGSWVHFPKERQGVTTHYSGGRKIKETYPDGRVVHFQKETKPRSSYDEHLCQWEVWIHGASEPEFKYLSRSTAEDFASEIEELLEVRTEIRKSV